MVMGTADYGRGVHALLEQAGGSMVLHGRSFTVIVMILLAGLSRESVAAPVALDFQGDYCEGMGDVAVLRLIDDSFRFFIWRTGRCLILPISISPSGTPWWRVLAGGAGGSRTAMAFPIAPRPFCRSRG